MKKYYNLIGNEAPIESWLLTYEDYPPTYPEIIAFNQMLTASSWPVLYYHQIPKRFLEEDPGFPVLLRVEVNFSLPPWIHSPLLPDSEHISGRYLIHTPHKQRVNRVLFSLAHSPPQENWEELCQKYPAQEHRWIWNADMQMMPGRTPFPEKFKLGMGDIVYLRDFSPDLLVDLSFGFSDTYTPIHLFCLHHACNLEHLKAPNEGAPVLKFKTWGHSKWLIYK